MRWAIKMAGATLICHCECVSLCRTSSHDEFMYRPRVAKGMGMAEEREWRLVRGVGLGHVNGMVGLGYGCPPQFHRRIINGVVKFDTARERE
ncbi:hypothetical protein BJ138DRAFT_1150126 [Hygrophoropsis aurantiaca]|uniref:Uncharacterized protein n=1 Tax=Hygrophoropsis aurantiaca TaxID=72124 RepID=A0ACB8AFJ8_9AGAM|nr:hypothetical protein BJ138DRAFT_1150126 [Hygrophoropsis aurantiaca]